MKARLITTLWLGVTAAVLIHLSAFHSKIETHQDPHKLLISDDLLMKEVYEILDNKCNVCHLNQNPFMVFKEKNMSKKARKIYKMVFLERKMPKGNEVRLTNEEYTKLEKWLFTQEIF